MTEQSISTARKPGKEAPLLILFPRIVYALLTYLWDASTEV